MSQMQILIEPAQSVSGPALARIHGNALPDDFMASLGLDFLERVYYPAALESRHAVTLCAVKANAPVGFVTVAHDSRGFTQDVVQRRFWAIGLYALRAIRRDPRYLIQCLQVFWSAVLSKPDPIQGEIVFIAVEASCRGAGIGKQLVQAACDYIRENHLPYCRTKTLARNQNVIRMYEGLGWKIRDHFRLLNRDYVTLVSGAIQ